MAIQLAAGRMPSVSRDDLAGIKTEFADLGGGFESSLIEYPDLMGGDGRQDFLHFFLYPLFAAPFVALVKGVGLHPNWGFTLVNSLLLAAACFVVARQAPLVAATAGFLSPIVWWVDKAHTEAFTFATLSVAAVAFGQQPGLALIAYALAGAQNAAIGVTYPVFAGLLWCATPGANVTRRVWMAAVGGAFLVAAPFVYTYMRLGRWSPMAEYAQRVVPSFAGLAAFLIEPNIGLLPSAPAYGVVLISAMWLAVIAVRAKGTLPTWWWWPAVIHLLLLFAWSQNPNANHGGTPGVNRWVLSLLAVSLPWLALVRGSLPHGGRVALNVLVAIAAIMSTAAHLPVRPENYRQPTALAERMWSAGWVHITPAEVFAERTQGREPAVLPAHDGACRVLLIADQQAPVQCAPPVEPLPSWCRTSGAMCYAVVEGEAVRYVAAPTNGFFYRVAEASWPAGGPLAAAMFRVLRDADPEARVWHPDNRQRWRQRFAGADIGVVLRTAQVAVVYISRTSAEGRRALETAGHRVIKLLPSSELTNLAVITTP